MNFSLDTETKNMYYAIEDFPQLKEFLQFHFNITNGHGCDLYQISSEGQLCKQLDDFMFFSYDTSEYQSANCAYMFYGDMQRSEVDFCKDERSEERHGKPDRDYTKKSQYSSFEDFAFSALKYIDSEMFTEYKTKCWRFLKIVYDNEHDLSPHIAAMCLNRMFSKKFKTSMLKYSNDKKTKAVLQKLRKTLSLLQ